MPLGPPRASECGPGHSPGVDGCARIAVEQTHRVDVGDEQGVALEAQALGSVERDAVGGAVDPLELEQAPIGGEPRDEPVAVLPEGAAVDVGYEVDVGHRIVQHRFGCTEPDIGHADHLV
jgi:hypothetical protein